ncbi:hypothetical protein V6N11_067596 [Hibiscus sabdariffa]|uniref:Uncharacterized protein n=1 Tax=Hibiscus sabdariffa TaxID=183260 RepID=A0ABR2SS56_9ROSI
MCHTHTHFPAGLRFEETADVEAWHCDVRVFSVFDLISGELLSYFYPGMYTRFLHYFDFSSLFLSAFLALVREKWALIVEQGKYGQTCVVALQNGSVAFNGAQQNDIGGVLSLHEFGHVAILSPAPSKLGLFNRSSNNIYGRVGCNLRLLFACRPTASSRQPTPQQRAIISFLSCHHLAQLTSAADLGKKRLCCKGN